MVMSPGGGAPPPPSSTPGAERAALPAGEVRGIVLHWTFLAGGLIVIADLLTVLLSQQAAGEPETIGFLSWVDHLLNVAFFSLAGLAVFRATGRVRLASLTGLLAGVIVGVMASAVAIVAPTPDTPPELTTDQIVLTTLIWNMGIGTVWAWAATWLAGAFRPTGKKRP